MEDTLEDVTKIPPKYFMQINKRRLYDRGLSVPYSTMPCHATSRLWGSSIKAAAPFPRVGRQQL